MNDGSCNSTNPFPCAYQRTVTRQESIDDNINHLGEPNTPEKDIGNKVHIVFIDKLQESESDHA